MKPLHVVVLFVVIGLLGLGVLFLWQHARGVVVAGPPGAPEPPARQVKSITVEELRRWLTPQTRRAMVSVIDVRTPEEFAAGSVPSAQNIDFQSEGFAERVRQLDPTKTYVVYCRSQNRSPKAAKVMVANGLPDVYVLEGGWLKWRETPGGPTP